MSEADDLPRDWWTTAHVATYLGITRSAVRTYAARGDMPAPDSHFGRTMVWKPRTIRNWHAGRPRKGKETTDDQ
jgi:hypothetical protein